MRITINDISKRHNYQQFQNLPEKDQSRLPARTEPFGWIKSEFYKHPSKNWRIFPTKPLH